MPRPPVLFFLITYVVFYTPEPLFAMSAGNCTDDDATMGRLMAVIMQARYNPTIFYLTFNNATLGGMCPEVDCEATARLARELERNRQNPTVSSRNCRPGKTPSSMHAVPSSSGRDGRGNWLSGRAHASSAPTAGRHSTLAREQGDSKHAQAPQARCSLVLIGSPLDPLWARPGG